MYASAGEGNVPLPFTGSPSALVFWATFALCIVPEFFRAGRLRAGVSSRRDDRNSLQILAASLGLAIGVGFAAPYVAANAHLPGSCRLWFDAGIVLMLTGVALRSYAIRSLGAFFTFDVATHPGQRVCDTGPYRFMRHPSYTAMLLWIAGIGFALCSIPSLILALAISAAGYGYRVVVEERVLHAQLGTPYAEYARRTRRFVPFLF